MGKTKNLTYGLLFAGLGLASLGGINNLNTNKGSSAMIKRRIKISNTFTKISISPLICILIEESGEHQ